MANTSPSVTRTENITTGYPKLFVVGCPRSGTTWLRQLLVCHPNVLPAPRETHLYRLFYKPFTYVPQVGPAQRFRQRVWFFKHYGLLTTILGASSDRMWRGVLRSYRVYERASNNVGPHTIIGFDELKALIREVRQRPEDDLERVKHLIAAIFDRYFHQAGGQAHTLFLEKTPMHIDCVDVILDQFPEARVIIVTRDGRDVCASWQARAQKHKWAQRSTEQLIRQWNRCVELSQKFQANPRFSRRIRMVRYEDLRMRPEAELESLLDFVELSHTPEQVQSFVSKLDISQVSNKGENSHVRQGKVGGWQQSLSEKDIQLWQTVAKDALLQLGYPV